MAPTIIAELLGDSEEPAESKIIDAYERSA